MVPDLSRQIKITRLQNPFEEIFEVPVVELIFVESLFALNKHIEGKFLQTVIQGTLVTSDELLLAQL
jgi:hypothetical protein